MRIDPLQHGWMTAPPTVAIMAALGEARFVGGAVRNALLGAAVADIDIAVPIAPDQAANRLRAKGIKVVETGFDHGTVTAILGHHAFEVTSLRRDVQTDGRHAKIAFTDDWAQDAARRDFTINALYASADGQIFDYASGIEDLEAGKVRFMGEPRRRIAEDYLRILRLFRFHAWYGKGQLDREALRAAAEAKERLKLLSGERLAKELLRLLEAPNPVPVLEVMAAKAILGELLPGALKLPRLARLVEIDAENGFCPDGIVRLAALLADGGQAHLVSDALKLSNARRLRLVRGLDGPILPEVVSVKDARRLLYRLGAGCFRDKVLLNWSARPDRGTDWRGLLEMAQNWQPPRLALTGDDVIAAGVPSGPDVGRILGELEDWWLKQDFAADEEALRHRLKLVIDQGHR